MASGKLYCSLVKLWYFNAIAMDDLRINIRAQQKTCKKSHDTNNVFLNSNR